MGMVPYEALYGRPCRTPLCWTLVWKRSTLDASFVQKTTKKIRVLKLNMREAQDRQRSYDDPRRKDIDIMERVGPVAYRFELPEVMHAFHKVFHVSMLRKCLHKDDEVLPKILVDLQLNMTLEMRPVRVLKRGDLGIRGEDEGKVPEMVREAGRGPSLSNLGPNVVMVRRPWLEWTEYSSPSLLILCRLGVVGFAIEVPR
ncbi:PREDICTED: uncharacterized protein LOC109127371 [Camelina sativa]|uniref:Uncharacterized protein LOC109127371 n=1 Tax=Camelina sativa TaxID=90675 RepID=A0ABM1QLA1_CAMSA|nr:PREDICTED: uncharacterized protein LOC109127371 [Camelina sativa]